MINNVQFVFNIDFLTSNNNKKQDEKKLRKFIDIYLPIQRFMIGTENIVQENRLKYDEFIE